MPAGTADDDRFPSSCFINTTSIVGVSIDVQLDGKPGAGRRCTFHHTPSPLSSDEDAGPLNGVADKTKAVEQLEK